MIHDWMLEKDSTIVNVSPDYAATRIVTAMNKQLSHNSRFRLRTEILQIIDSVWCELMDDVDVKESDLNNNIRDNGEEYILRLIQEIIGCCTLWQNEAIIRIVELLNRWQKKIQHDLETINGEDVVPAATQVLNKHFPISAIATLPKEEI